MELFLAAMMLVSRPSGLPADGMKSLLEYHRCLLEPTISHIQRGLPAETRAREEIVTLILGDCVPVRTLAISNANSRIATSPEFTDPEARRTSIAGFVSTWENGLRFMIVEYERWVQETGAFEDCLDAGVAEC